MDDIAIGGCVRYINGNRNTLAQSEQWAWDLAVIRHSFDSDARPNVEGAWLDAQAVIRLPCPTTLGCKHAGHQRMQGTAGNQASCRGKKPSAVYKNFYLQPNVPISSHFQSRYGIPPTCSCSIIYEVCVVTPTTLPRASPSE
jgi:hypothetical protein